MQIERTLLETYTVLTVNQIEIQQQAAETSHFLLFCS